MPCGTPIESKTLIQSPPVNIKGVSATYLTSNSVSVSNHISCGKSAILDIETVILSNSTGSNSYALIELPEGVRFKEYLGCTNQLTCPDFAGAVLKPDGKQEILVKLPESSPAGTAFEYSFLIYGTKDAIPGMKTIQLYANEHFKNIPCETSPDKLCQTLKVSTGFGQGPVAVDADPDCNGIPFSQDIDDDNDGITDTVEGDGKRDTDKDGIPDSLDIDSDNDGVPDNIEAQAESGYKISSGMDSDKDGLDDAYDSPENKGLNPVDTDSDGRPDYIDNDSDNDGVPDFIEGCDSNSDGKPDRLLTTADSDKDGLIDSFDSYDFTSKIGYVENNLGSNAAIQDFDKDKFRDWRDNDDDNDLIVTRIEDFNNDKDFSNDDIDLDGHPDYLDASYDCELFIPEGFSPNNDGIHDFFQILCIQKYPNARLMVFNRQGIKVFEKHQYGNLSYWGSNENAWWWGRASYSYITGSGPLPMGNYYYVLELEPGNRKTGTVMLAY
jgi:gliding motility-associated-like protein